MMNTPTNFMNSKKRVIFRTDKGSFYVMDGEKKKYKPKAAFLKNSGKRVANLNSVPSPIRPARVATVPKTKTAKKMEAMRRNIARTYRPSNNMSRPAVTPRVQGTVLPRPNLANAVARMKASAAKLKANRVSTKRA